MTAVTKTAAAPRPKLTLAGLKPTAPAVIPCLPGIFPLNLLVRAPENVRRIADAYRIGSMPDMLPMLPPPEKRS